MTNTTTHTKPLIPKLRFKEFEGEWEKELVNSIASKLKVGFVGTCEPFYTSKTDGILLLRTGNLKGVNIELDEEKYVTKEFHNKNKKSQIQPYDLLLARHGGNGEICRVPKNFPIANCLNIVILRTNEKVNSTFFQLVYSTFSVQKQIKAVTAGSTQVVINTKEIGKLKVVFPNLPEQQKIANFLTAVDTKLQQLTTKKETLALYKKGVMQQLFPSTSSGQVPQLRFKPDNTNEPSLRDSHCEEERRGKLKQSVTNETQFPNWEEKRLGDLTFKVGKKNKENIKYPIYSINNQEGFRPQSEQFDGLDSNVRGYDISLYKIVESETFAYNPARINVGSIGYSYDLEKVIVSSLYVCFKTKEELEDLFLLAYLDTYNFQKDILRYEEGGVRQYLFYENFSMIKIPLPSNQEQQKIATYLSAIDLKIEAVQTQIAKTQAFKKGLLQQMFV